MPFLLGSSWVLPDLFLTCSLPRTMVPISLKGGRPHLFYQQTSKRKRTPTNGPGGCPVKKKSGLYRMRHLITRGIHCAMSFNSWITCDSRGCGRIRISWKMDGTVPINIAIRLWSVQASRRVLQLAHGCGRTSDSAIDDGNMGMIEWRRIQHSEENEE